MAERANVFAHGFVHDPEDPPGYRAGTAEVGAQAGGSELRVKLYELPAGESLCPYHYETVEEWLMLLEGDLELRTPTGTERLDRGALVCFPPGAGGAHKVTTPASGATARFVMFSSAAEPVVAVYPDSDKIGVWVPGGADNVMLHRRDGRAGYYDGELGGEPSR